jgi:chemotaxis protein CheX
MDLGESQICDVTRKVWSSVLGLDLTRRGGDSELQGQRLVGCVYISGAWEGSVTLESTPAMSRRAAAILFGVEEGSATPEELRDSLGELTNIIGGNIKGLLPEPSRLSLPVVVEGGHLRLTVKGARLVGAVTFMCDNQPLRVTVLRRQA